MCASRGGNKKGNTSNEYSDSIQMVWLWVYGALFCFVSFFFFFFKILPDGIIFKTESLF